MPKLREEAAARRDLIVLGLGNLLLRDEGLGVHVIRALENNPIPCVSPIDGGTGGESLLFLIEDACGLIVVDSINCGSEPGAVFRFRPGDVELSSAVNPTSIHDLRFTDILQLAERKRCLPPTVILAVQVGVVDYGLELSAPVSLAVPRIVRAVESEVAYWHQHHRFAPCS